MDDQRQWMENNILKFIKLFYNQEVTKLFSLGDVVFTNTTSINKEEFFGKILIPYDTNGDFNDFESWQIKFENQEMPLIQKTDKPIGWNAVPCEDSPVWWVSPHDTLVPAWDLWGVCFRLLSFHEEISLTSLDRHGRYDINDSPRYKHGLSHVPLINNAIALLIDALLHKRIKEHNLFSGVSKYTLEPMVLLSHDWDNLRGNNFWTQIARVKNAVQFASKGDWRNCWQKMKYFFVNVVLPHKYYYSDQLHIWCLEKKYGYKSVNYILNGSGGRYGARASIKLAKELAKKAPMGSEFGVHYNYGYASNPVKLKKQIDEIQTSFVTTIKSGRAHYLKFNPLRDFKTLKTCHVEFDESIGWINKNSYRVGIAGPFVPMNVDLNTLERLITLPLTFNDGQMFRSESLNGALPNMIEHIKMVGGCVSILVHPGDHNNPERPEMIGVYEKTLKLLKLKGFRSVTPTELLSLWYE